MNSERRHMDDLLRDKFVAFEGEIPLSDWSAIEKKLDRKKRHVWIRWAAVLLIPLAAWILYKGFYSNKIKPVNKESNHIPVPEIISPGSTLPLETEHIVPDENKSELNGSSETISPIQHKKITGNPVKKQVPLKSPEKENADSPQSEKFTIFKLASLMSPDIYSMPVQEEVQKAKDLGLVYPLPTNHHKNHSFILEAGIHSAPLALGLDAIKENKGTLIHRAFFNDIAGSSSMGNGMNNGVHIQLGWHDSWFIRSGLYLTNYSVYHKYQYTITEAPRFNSKNEISDYVPIAPETVSYSGNASIKYATVPLMAGKRIYLNNHLGIESRVGIQLSMLRSSEGYDVNPTYLNLESLNSNNSIRKWTAGMSAAAGVFYKTNNNLIFTVEPNYSTLLGSAKTSNYPVKTRLYNYGLNLNLNYILKGGNR